MGDAREIARQIIAVVLGFNALDDLAALPEAHPNRKHVEAEVNAIIEAALLAERERCVGKVKERAAKVKGMFATGNKLADDAVQAFAEVVETDIRGESDG